MKIKSVLTKDFFRELIRTKTKFLSIVCMIMLGILVSVGLKITSPIMKKTIINYMDENKMFDIRVKADRSFDENIIQKIKDENYVNNIDCVENSKYLVEGKNIELNVRTYSDKFNIPIVIEGNFPNNDKEILLDSYLKSEYKVGDRIKLSTYNNSNLENYDYIVCGFANSVDDMVVKNFEKNNKHYNKSFAFINKEGFKTNSKNELNISIKGLKEISFDSKDYKNRINVVKNNIEKILSDYSERVYNEDIKKIKNKEEELENQKYSIRFILNKSEIIDEKSKEDYKKNLYEIEKGLKDIRDSYKYILKPKFYVNTRYDTHAYSFYESADKLKVVANVFSGFFFLIATLVSLTTMIRMVEEHRIQIGTLKALGYSNTKISRKFFLYGTLASTIGIVIGILLAHFVILRIVYKAYSRNYIIPDYKLEIYPSIILLFSLLAYICTTFSALISIHEMLKERVSNLLRKKTPKNGTRIFIERIKFLWKRMNFFRKVSARNIFRYKARMWMTIIGVAGCSGLLFLGFSLRNSTKDIGEKQFDKLFNYDIILGIDPSKNTKELYDFLNKNDIVKNKVEGYIETTKIKGGNNQDISDVQVYVFDEMENIFNFKNMEGDDIKLDYDGALMSIKLAHISKTFIKNDISINILGESEVYKVNNIVENYFGHSIFMTKNYFEKITKKDIFNNAIILKFNKNMGIDEKAVIEKLYNMDAVVNIQSNRDAKAALSNLSKSMNSVIWVMVICSIFLAIVVLYNLTNINISERKLELSTIKVLGMYSSEITVYVYRETLILTVIGLVFGIFMGVSMFKYVVWELPPQNTFININTNIVDYLLAIGITILITLLISIIIHKKLKNVDMVEALKTVE